MVADGPTGLAPADGGTPGETVRHKERFKIMTVYPVMMNDTAATAPSTVIAIFENEEHADALVADLNAKYQQRGQTLQALKLGAFETFATEFPTA